MQYAGQQDLKVVRRYFTGTTVLRKGQILHYQENAPVSGDLNLRFGSAVEVVNADNIGFPAGVVPDGEAGKVGPCYVELIVPQEGDVLQVEADGTTDIAAKDLLEPDATLGGLIKATAAAGDWLFRSQEAWTDASLKALWVTKV